MTVRSTMSNIMTSGSSSSFGGILARYDTENFGKFFGTGTLAPRATSSRVDALEDLDQGDNVVENIETERMYPPRLVLDFNQYPIRSLTTTEARSNMSSQIENVIARFDFDRNAEEINVANSGSTVYLRGKVKSARLARLVESVVSLQAGVEEVVNELEILSLTHRALTFLDSRQISDELLISVRTQKRTLFQGNSVRFDLVLPGIDFCFRRLWIRLEIVESIHFARS